MKCLVKNILPGPIKFAAFSLEYKEEKQVEYTETLRYYAAMGYLRLLDIYPESDTPLVVRKKKTDN